MELFGARPVRRELFRDLSQEASSETLVIRSCLYLRPQGAYGGSLLTTKIPFKSAMKRNALFRPIVQFKQQSAFLEQQHHRRGNRQVLLVVMVWNLS
jgi:hypothetical protein